MTEMDRYKKALGMAIDALQMYANPEFYHAIAILADPPTGGFDKDVSNVKELGFDYDRPMPGKLARATLKRLESRYGDLSIR
jgi:hypothetical protein